MIVNFFKKITPFVLIACIVVSSVLVFTSCRTTNISSRERQIQREKKRRDKGDTVLYQRAYKRHMKNQSKATQKEMKRNYRKSQRFNERREEFFLIRIIREKIHQHQKQQRGDA